MKKCVLVVASHPDDEVLGCGGTIARHAEEGDEVHIAILAEGITSRDEERAADRRKDEIGSLRENAREAASILGAKEPVFAGLPDNRMDTLPLIDVVKRVETIVADIRPTVVYTHHGSDLNVDHRVTHQAVMTACRALPDSIVREIYAFETVSSTEWSTPAIGDSFLPNRYVDIAAWLERKLSALSVYTTEMRPFPHARSLEAIEALARWRGVSAGLEAAEAFVVLRQII